MRVSAPGGTGNAYLVLDTRRFSQFTVDSFSIETLISGLTIPGSESPHSTAIDMSFTVVDNVGISFANFLQYIMDQKLQVSYDGMTLLLRVLFIGHEPVVGGNSYTSRGDVVQSITIPCFFSSIEVQLTETRGVYTCKLFPMLGMPSNAAYNSRWTNIGQAVTYFSGPAANTLGAVVQSFENELNRQSLDRYKQLNAVTQSPGQPNKTTRQFGRPVQYMITIPSKWEAYTFSGPSVGAASEINFAELLKTEAATESRSTEQQQRRAQQNAAAPAQDAYVSVLPEWTITEVLDKIFSQTTEIAKLANFVQSQANQQTIRFYKQLVSVTSDDSTFTVHVDVVEYEVPNVQAPAGAGTAQGASDSLFMIDPSTGNRVPKNFIEYEYIFSGKNLDVLSFDLKIENLNFLLMQGSKLGEGEIFRAAISGDEQKDGEGAASETKTVGAMRAKDPLLMPVMTPQQQTNFSNYSATSRPAGELTPQEINQQYMKNLSAFYNAAPYTAKLELRGNPDLLAGVVLQRLPRHIRTVTVNADGTVSNTNLDNKRAYRRELEQSLGISTTGVYRGTGPLSGPSFVSTPLFVKVNVFGPNVDFVTNELVQGEAFTQRLFIDNYYFLSKIVSKIEGAKFTHEADLMTYSVYGAGSIVTNTQGGARPTEVR